MGGTSGGLGGLFEGALPLPTPSQAPPRPSCRPPPQTPQNAQPKPPNPPNCNPQGRVVPCDFIGIVRSQQSVYLKV
jgi:hypothetical protein